MWCFKTNKEPVQRTSIQRLFCLLVLLCAAAGLSAAGKPDTETAQAYFEIAQAYTDVAKYDKAAEFFQKAAKDPGHKNAAEYNLARVYGLQGDWEKARPILERQHTEAPGNVLILKAYAYSLASTGKHERAIEIYRKLYDEDKENPDSALNYARILVFTKRYDEAQTLIDELQTVFAETNEKKVLDELTEKIKQAQEEPEKADEPAEGASDSSAQPNTALPDTAQPADGAAAAKQSGTAQPPAPDADPAAKPAPDAPTKPGATQPADGAAPAKSSGTAQPAEAAASKAAGSAGSSGSNAGTADASTSGSKQSASTGAAVPAAGRSAGASSRGTASPHTGTTGEKNGTENK